MTSIGETLRRERLQRGLDLQQVSESTKIGTRMLQAMEQDDFSKLPGGVFTRSFIKQYAVALGLNANSLDEQLSHLRTESDEPSRSDVRKDVIPERSHYTLSDYNSSRSSGSLLMSLVWVVLAMGVGSAVYFFMNRSPVASVGTAKPVERLPARAVLPPEPARPQSAQATAATRQVPIQVEITATEKAWVFIAADGKTQFVGYLGAGQKRMVEAAAKVKLVTGNAGALTISLNGKAVDPIGPRGQVRTVELTQEGIQVVPRTPKPASLP